MKHLFFLLFTSFQFHLMALCDSFIVITIPKSGTHLLDKAVRRLTNKSYVISWPVKSKIVWDECWVLPNWKFDRLTDSLDQFYLLTHLMYKDEYAQMITEKKCRGLFLYRDPRDQIISAFFYLRNHPKWPRKFFSQEISEFIFEMIDQKEISDPYRPTKGILDFYAQYLPWMSIPGIYSLRFEDLVGPSGGGSKEKQEQVLSEIAIHLDVDLTEDNRLALIHSLFGGSITFRNGQIGEWRNYFSEEHKEAFKKKGGQLLMDLGYESDLNW